MLLACCLSAGSVWAQSEGDSGFNITTSPLPIRLTVEPGKTVTTDLRVKNSGRQPERIKVGLMKFGASGDLGRPDIKDREAGDDYFDWVKFGPQVFDAPPDQWMNVKMTIAVPKTAGLGYYYAVTFTRATNPTSKNKTAVIGSTATLVLLDVGSGNAKRALELTSLSVDRKMYEFLPARFELKVHNSGNVHVVPSGSIFISRGGKKVATLDVNAAQGNILPNSNRVFSLEWNDGFPLYRETLVDEKPAFDKQGKPLRTLQWDFSKAAKLRFGHYAAKLVLTYNDGTRDVPLEGTLSFWVIPWRLLGLFVGVPLLLVAIIMYLIVSRRRVKRQLKQLAGRQP
jgi:hypothetical protein